MEISHIELRGSSKLEIQEIIEKHKEVFKDVPMKLLLETGIEYMTEVKPYLSPVRVKHFNIHITIRWKLRG